MPGILLDGALEIGGGLLPPAQLGMSIPSQEPELLEFPELIGLRSQRDGLRSIGDGLVPPAKLGVGPAPAAQEHP